MKAGQAITGKMKKLEPPPFSSQKDYESRRQPLELPLQNR